MTDTLIACDLVVGSGAPVLKTLKPGSSTVVANIDIAPTAEFQSNKNADFSAEQMLAAIEAAGTGDAMFEVHATAVATQLIGDSIATNVIMLGYAAQKGLLPVSIASLQEAIRLNGANVVGNLKALSLGRLAASSPAQVIQLLGDGPEVVRLESIEDVLDSRSRLLTSYQDARYARDYREFASVVQRHPNVARLKGGERFVREVAITLAKLMAYKDEYEVARLHADPQFMERLREQFAGKFKLTFHLAPPFLPGRDASGRPKKRAFGGWMMPVFKALARLRFLRGTPFDLFGYTAERRLERRLIADYRALVLDIVGQVNERNLDTAVELARAASEIGGYGPVKDASVQKYEIRRDALLASLKNSPLALRPRAA